LPPPRLSARYRLREEAFAGEEDAPKDPMGVRIATGALPECGC
jgi:hypothetical protein